MTSTKENDIIRRMTPLYGIWVLAFLLSYASLSCTAPTKIDSSNTLGIIATPAPTIPNQNTAYDQVLNTVRNEVNGMGIGSSYKELTERFGKPHSKKIGGNNPCGSNKSVLQYNGIAFTMDDDGENNIVVVIEIISPNWELVPGVRTGMPLEQVRAVMGRNGIHTIKEVESLSYADGDGYLNFQFADGKVAKITRNLNMC